MSQQLLNIIIETSEKTLHKSYHLEKDCYLDFILESISKDQILSDLLIFKGGVEGFIQAKGMIDFNFDYDFIISEIFNQESELLQPAPRESRKFLYKKNIDYLYNNIYFPIQDQAKKVLGIDTNIHLTDGLNSLNID